MNKAHQSLSTGHMGIVTKWTITGWELVNGVNIPVAGHFDTIEGNTTKFGEREGKTVATRIRSFSQFLKSALAFFRCKL